MSFRLLATIAAIASGAFTAPFTTQVHAQSFCSSDGQRAPVALLERFISADCAACWGDPATPKPARGQVAIDWIVPGSQGEDAPLSAAASRDALTRLEALGQPAPAHTASFTRARAAGGKGRLRVAHGLPLGGYLGASIELTPAAPARGGPVTAWLALVETVPPGTDGTPVERNLVRNLLVSMWNGDSLLLNSEQSRFFESRPISMPSGANPDRLRLVGWVQDTKGRITHMAQSRCSPPGRSG
jgi:hypothetical protein